MDSNIQSSPEAKLGVLYGVAAYSVWGFSAIYWKWLFAAGAIEVLAHRVLWASVIIGVVLVLRKRLPHVLALVRDWRMLRMLLITDRPGVG